MHHGAAVSGYCATRCPHSGFFQSVDVVYTNKNSTLQVINYVVGGVFINALLITNGPIKSAPHFCVLVLNVAAEGANK